MSTVNFEFGTLIRGSQNSFGTYDADINPEVRNATTNANLTLYVRIKFQKIEPTAASNTYNDYDGTAVPIRAWRQGEFERFKRTFLSQCRRTWHGKFWLKTPNTYNSLNWPAQNPTHRCNLYCQFNITEQATANGAHAVIPVVRVNGNHFFRSHMLLYSNRDVRVEQVMPGTNFLTTAHEIGHLIGLEHPGNSLAACTTGAEHACYAAADGTADGVMGMGRRIYDRHAEPWKKAAASLTGVAEANWTVSRRRAYPTRL